VEKFSKRNGITWRNDGWPVMQSILKPSEKGSASISHFTISAKDADKFNNRLAFSAGTGGQQVSPGKYVRLHVKDCGSDLPMMSDTPMERRSNWDIRREAHGRVLIAGLGIGMILHPILDAWRGITNENGNISRYQTVEHVTVVELNQDIIDLVWPSLARYNDRLTIVQGDINEYHPGKEKFDTVYFDIWPNISEDNLPTIAKLHRRWKNHLNRSGTLKPWMSSWMVESLRARRRDNDRW
jgi:hypothetical protein